MQHGSMSTGLWRPLITAGLLVLLGAAAASAGESAVEELEARLETAAGAERLEVLVELAYRASFRSVEVGRRYGQEALALARALGDRKGEGAALRNLAVADSIAGEHRASIAHAEQALAIFEQLGERERIASSLNVIGVGHRMLNEYDEALQFYERSLAIDRELGNQVGVARTLSNVGNVHYDRGDFGLARSQSLTRLTETGAILGTLAYLPPEQVTEQRFTAASDVYALGAVAYEVLTGLPAFPGGTPVEVIQQILRGEVVPPRQLRPEIPDDLERLVLSMLATDPAARPSDAEVVARLTALAPPMP